MTFLNLVRRSARASLCICPAGLLAVFAALHAAAPDVTRPTLPTLLTNHGPIRSGVTIREEIQGSIDMLLTDTPMTDAEIQLVYDRRGVHLYHVATAVTAVVPCYNVDGIEGEPLNFSSETLAAIFLGKIAKWNDPAIVALNPSSHLPAARIVLIRHTADDGSTYALSDFLSKTNEGWRRSVGRVRSLAALSVSGKRASADETVELVSRTPNSISYAELWAARAQGLHIGRVRNRTGRFVEATPESVATAAQTASAGIGTDFRASIADAPGLNSYPIASFTWVVIAAEFADEDTRRVVTSFLRWVLTEGQRSAEGQNLGRLPRSVADRELGMIDSLK